MIYSLCSFGSKLSSLNVQHEIATANVFHHKVNASLGLETSMQVQQERMSFLVSNEKHALFRPCAFHLVVLDDELLLQNLDGVKLLRSFGLREHDFSKVSLAENCQEVKVIKTNSATCALCIGRRRYTIRFRDHSSTRRRDVDSRLLLRLRGWLIWCLLDRMMDLLRRRLRDRIGRRLRSLWLWHSITKRPWTTGIGELLICSRIVCGLLWGLVLRCGCIIGGCACILILRVIGGRPYRGWRFSLPLKSCSCSCACCRNRGLRGLRATRNWPLSRW